MLTLIESSIIDVKELYGKLDTLDRSWKGTLIITFVQYLFAIHAEENGGKRLSDKGMSDSYKYCNMDTVVADLVRLRNDVCHRCGMKSTNEGLNTMLFSNDFRKMLELCGIVSNESEKSPNLFSAAIKMAGD